MRKTQTSWSFEESFGKWVHPSVPNGGEEFARHSRFLGYSIVLSSIALGSLPVLAVMGNIGLGIELLFPAAIFLLMSSAVLLSRTGRLQIAKLSALLTLGVALVAFSLQINLPAGMAILMLSILPIEAALWKIDRPGLTGGIVAAVIALVVWAFTGGQTVSQFDVGLLVACAIGYSAYSAHRFSKSRSDAAATHKLEHANFELITNSLASLVMRQTVDGRVLFASSAARDVLGASASELTSLGVIDRIHLQDRVVYLRTLSQAISSDTPVECTVRIRCKGNDSKLWGHFAVSCKGIRNPSTGQNEVICTVQENTELVAVREELSKLIETSGEHDGAQRRFLATMSHELRTPLNAIVGFSDILQQELFGKLPYERHREYAQLISESGKHLLHVVNDLLDVSRIESGKYELELSTFSLHSIAESTVKMLGTMAQASGVKVECSVDQALPLMTADSRACQQILINLVSNAIKFSPDQGHVRISAKQFGRSVKIVVKDNGVGIDPAFIPMLGQPFMQADFGNGRKFEGSGLGLSVVKGLVALHNGDFQVQSVVGKGTTLTITLPLKSASSKPVPADQSNSLVFLDHNTVAQAAETSPTLVTVNKGDRRARVSA